jgi:uncharacterized protein YndB with AHSA1/START domain
MEEKHGLHFSAIIAAPIVEVWQAWTTLQGVKSFFAPDCLIDLRPGGAYEMYFDLDSKPGDRGGEGCMILAIDEPHMLSFSWNAPPEFPEIRKQRTHVTVLFEEFDDNKTKVILTHDGWGNTDDWKQVQRYFIRAWGEIVLPRLQRRFVEGPINWEDLDQ